MKNKDIIREAAIQTGMVTAEEAEELDSKGMEIPFHTAAGWKQKGYSVRDGEAGTEVKLWKKKDGDNRFYLAKAYLYSSSQVVEDM